MRNHRSISHRHIIVNALRNLVSEVHAPDGGGHAPLHDSTYTLPLVARVPQGAIPGAFMTVWMDRHEPGTTFTVSEPVRLGMN